MTADKLEANGNPVNEAAQTNDAPKTPAKTRKTKEEAEVTALSLQQKPATGSQGLELMTHQGLPNNRPMAASHLKVLPQEGLPNNRPIEASHLNIVSTYTAVGGSRPVTASGMEVMATLTISGNRPIAASHLQISETYAVMGNRPVASNETDDPEALMGFLD